MPTVLGDTIAPTAYVTNSSIGMRVRQSGHDPKAAATRAPPRLTRLAQKLDALLNAWPALDRHSLGELTDAHPHQVTGPALRA